MPQGARGVSAQNVRLTAARTFVRTHPPGTTWRQSAVLVVAMVSLVSLGSLSTTAAQPPSKKPARPTTRQADASPPLATVNGQPVTTADVNFLALLRNVPAAQRDARAEELLDEAIDRALIRQFLDSRKIAAPAEPLADRQMYLDTMVRERGSDPKTFYAQLGLTPERIQDELAHELRWLAFAELAITPEQLAAEFEAHRAEYDGTRVHVWQILRSLPQDAPESDVARETALLADLRRQIEAGSLTFEAAAREHSQAPTRAAGGKVGWIERRGKLPEPVAGAAFALSPGTLSEPVRSPFGVHLVWVDEREPGQLSREDARPELVSKLQRQLLEKTRQELRASATIGRGTTSNSRSGTP